MPSYICCIMLGGDKCPARWRYFHKFGCIMLGGDDTDVNLLYYARW